MSDIYIYIVDMRPVPKGSTYNCLDMYRVIEIGMSHNVNLTIVYHNNSKALLYFR